ncbi:MAG: hypothetical protein M3Y17_11645 [Actinomycetota bacterium]|nr:hypothetical protein [Actinomycetota bacterium]
MKLIGAGLPRTATLTQKVALEMLGLGPCYHMVDVLADLPRVKQWQDALDGHPDWDAIFKGYQSTVDWPGGFFYRELMEAYPDAKVLLSVRDPESWERSMRATVWGVMFGDDVMTHLSRAQARISPSWDSYMRLLKGLLWEGSGTLRGEHHRPGALAQAAERYNEQVRRDVPPERLLEWRVTEGWEPLCTFLALPTPDVPLPHVNDADTFAARVIDGALAALGEWWVDARPAELDGLAGDAH